MELKKLLKIIRKFRDGFKIPATVGGVQLHWRRIDTLNMLIKTIKKEYKK